MIMQEYDKISKLDLIKKHNELRERHNELREKLASISIGIGLSGQEVRQLTPAHLKTLSRALLVK